MMIETSVVNDTNVAKINSDRLTASVVPDFNQSIRDLIPAHSGTLILDLSLVEFIDSSGLGALIALSRSLPKRDDLKLAGAHGAVLEMFRITHIDRVFELYPSVDDAV